jgi:putative lipoic acid-binding regulatory protein
MISEEEAGLQFPCAFQVKAMGHDDGAFSDVVINIISQHCEHIDHNSLSTRPSRTGKYVSVSITIEAQNREQLDNIYDALTAHEKVLMRL